MFKDRVGHSGEGERDACVRTERIYNGDGGWKGGGDPEWTL